MITVNTHWSLLGANCSKCLISTIQPYEGGTTTSTLKMRNRSSESLYNLSQVAQAGSDRGFKTRSGSKVFFFIY